MEQTTAISSSVSRYSFCHSAIAVATFTANIWFWRFTNNYFSPTADTIPLLHTWSLGVEEQFYLIFPLLFLVPKLRSISTLRWLVGAGVLGSFALSAWLAYRAPGFQFYNLPPRAWELGIGGLLALGDSTMRSKLPFGTTVNPMVESATKNTA